MSRNRFSPAASNQAHTASSSLSFNNVETAFDYFLQQNQQLSELCYDSHNNSLPTSTSAAVVHSQEFDSSDTEVLKEATRQEQNLSKKRKSPTIGLRRNRPTEKEVNKIYECYQNEIKEHNGTSKLNISRTAAKIGKLVYGEKTKETVSRQLLQRMVRNRENAEGSLQRKSRSCLMG
ncbi:hypothetical protein RCL1_003347 [Eukaryota sp. TZLM3-RCL]